jgi:GntR family transcriptional repressor for pyruvate dehydrogenase complex
MVRAEHLQPGDQVIIVDDILCNFPSITRQNRSRPDDVLALFKQMIRDGQIRPGERLPNERDLAQRLGVSRPSLREAIRALAAMNVLEVRRGDGTYVTSLDARVLAEPLELILSIDSSAIFALFELRRIIEPHVAALAAERASEAELALLRRELERGATVQHQPDALIEHDSELHRLIHEAAHNPLLPSISSSLARLARASRLRTVQLPQNARLTIKEHRAIVEAICARRSAEAARLMLAHLERIERQLRLMHRTRGRSDMARMGRRIGSRISRAARGAATPDPEG